MFFQRSINEPLIGRETATSTSSLDSVPTPRRSKSGKKVQEGTHKAITDADSEKRSKPTFPNLIPVYSGGEQETQAANKEKVILCKRAQKCLGFTESDQGGTSKILSKEDIKKTKVHYCPQCFKYLSGVMRIMHMATEDTHPEMTVDNFQELFEKVLFPLFNETDIGEESSFMRLADQAFESWKGKFIGEHKKHHHLKDKKRVTKYSFYKQTVNEEVYRQFMLDRFPSGVMSFQQFVQFLDQFKLNEKIETIEDAYIDIKLEKERACCGLKKLRCIRICPGVTDDEKGRLRRILNPDFESSSTLGLGSFFTNAYQIYGQVKKQIKFFGQIYFCNSIYWISMRPENQSNIHYKWAMLIASQSLASSFFITYSSIINLKYSLKQFGDAKQGTFATLWNYLMLTFLGVVMTVVPIQFLDIIRLAIFLITALLCCCRKGPINKVTDAFDIFTEWLTQLDKYQASNIKFTADMTKLTYMDSLWLLLQFLLFNRILDVPDIHGDKKTQISLIVTTVLSIISLVNKIIQVRTESHALHEETIVYLMNKMTANNCWVPFAQDCISGNLKKCLDFTSITIPHPCGISYVTGLFKKLKFEFTDLTLRSFVYDLGNWVGKMSESQQEEMKKTKLKFKISVDMLLKVSKDAVANLIVNFPYEYFILDVIATAEQVKQIKDLNNQPATKEYKIYDYDENDNWGLQNVSDKFKLSNDLLCEQRFVQEDLYEYERKHRIEIMKPLEKYIQKKKNSDKPRKISKWMTQCYQCKQQLNPNQLASFCKVCPRSYCQNCILLKSIEFERPQEEEEEEQASSSNDEDEVEVEQTVQEGGSKDQGQSAEEKSEDNLSEDAKHELQQEKLAEEEAEEELDNDDEQAADESDEEGEGVEDKSKQEVNDSEADNDDQDSKSKQEADEEEAEDEEQEDKSQQEDDESKAGKESQNEQDSDDKEPSAQQKTVEKKSEQSDDSGDYDDEESNNEQDYEESDDYGSSSDESSETDSSGEEQSDSEDDEEVDEGQEQETQKEKILERLEHSKEAYYCQVTNTGCMRVIEFLLEYIALFDFITDIIVTVQLLNSKNTGWAIMTVSSMLAPLYVSSIQITQFLLDRVLRRDKTKNNMALLSISWVSIFPLFMVFMFIMDQVFVINSTVFELIGLILGLTACLDCVDHSYEILFQMKKHEVSGFRRMRTITQLMFESIIQFGVQFWMLGSLKSAEDAEEFGISKESILISIALAVGHGILESIQLYFESMACDTSFINYCVICFNGRFGWVPFVDDILNVAKKQQNFEKTADENEDQQDKEYSKGNKDWWEMDQTIKTGVYLERFDMNYANINEQIGCIDVSIPFKFSDASISSFCQTIADIPKMRNREFMISFGSSIEELSVGELHQLIKVCGPKTDLHIWLPYDKFDEMISRSRSYETACAIEHTKFSETDISQLFRDCCLESETAIFNAYLVDKVPSLVQVRLKNRRSKETNQVKDSHHYREKLNIFGLAHSNFSLRTVLEKEMLDQASAALSYLAEGKPNPIAYGDVYHSFFGEELIDVAFDSYLADNHTFSLSCLCAVGDLLDVEVKKYFYTSSALRDDILQYYKDTLDKRIESTLRWHNDQFYETEYSLQSLTGVIQDAEVRGDSDAIKEANDKEEELRTKGTSLLRKFKYFKDNEWMNEDRIIEEKFFNERAKEWMHAFKIEDVKLDFQNEFQESFLEPFLKDKSSWERKFITRDEMNDQPEWKCYQYEEGKQEDQQKLNDRIQKDSKEVRMAEIESDDVARILDGRTIELRLKDKRSLYVNNKGRCAIALANSGEGKENTSEQQRRFKVRKVDVNKIELNSQDEKGVITNLYIHPEDKDPSKSTQYGYCHAIGDDKNDDEVRRILSLRRASKNPKEKNCVEINLKNGWNLHAASKRKGDYSYLAAYPKGQKVNKKDASRQFFYTIIQDQTQKKIVKEDEDKWLNPRLDGDGLNFITFKPKAKVEGQADEGEDGQEEEEEIDERIVVMEADFGKLTQVNEIIVAKIKDWAADDKANPSRQNFKREPDTPKNSYITHFRIESLKPTIKPTWQDLASKIKPEKTQWQDHGNFKSGLDEKKKKAFVKLPEPIEASKIRIVLDRKLYTPEEAKETWDGGYIGGRIGFIARTILEPKDQQNLFAQRFLNDYWAFQRVEKAMKAESKYEFAEVFDYDYCKLVPHLKYFTTEQLKSRYLSEIQKIFNSLWIKIGNQENANLTDPKDPLLASFKKKSIREWLFKEHYPEFGTFIFDYKFRQGYMPIIFDGEGMEQQEEEGEQEQEEGATGEEGAKQDPQSIVGTWLAKDLTEDDGAPALQLIKISATEIKFPDGGDVFANGPYELKEGAYVAVEGDETIKFQRKGKQLAVTYEGDKTILYDNIDQKEHKKEEEKVQEVEEKNVQKFEASIKSKKDGCEYTQALQVKHNKNLSKYSLQVQLSYKITDKDKQSKSGSLLIDYQPEEILIEEKREDNGKQLCHFENQGQWTDMFMRTNLQRHKYLKNQDNSQDRLWK